MNNSLSSFLISKNIFVKEEYLDAIHGNGSMTQAQVFNLLLREDLQLYIDKDKAKSHIDISKCDFAAKVTNVSNKVFFAQIIGYSNIAEPVGSCEKGEDNLDVLEKTESKFLQGDDEGGKKVEKVIYKFQLTDGVSTFFGFEHEPLINLQYLIRDNNKYPKIYIGPNVEVRRGIFYFKKTNLKIVDELK